MIRIITLFSLLFVSIMLSAQVSESDGFDGRFALGMEEKQILFGYPNSQPSSYFMIRVQKPNGGFMYGTNKAKTREKATLLKSVGAIDVRNGVQVQQNKFRFSVFEILQEIIPINNLDQPALPGEVIRRYQVSYTITNQTEQDFSMGFAQFLDFKIDDNDACRMEYQQMKIDQSTILEPNEPSFSIKLYQKGFDKDAFAGELEVNKKESNTDIPSKLYFGDYRDLEPSIWDWNLSRTNYLDAALVMVWDDIILKANRSDTKSFSIGVPDFVKGGMELADTKLSEDYRFINHSLYFNLGVSKLNAAQQNALNELFVDKSIKRIIINGFSDQVGSSIQCQYVSEQRAKSVKSFIEETIGEDLPMEINAFGSTRAGVLKDDQILIGNAKDRKVDLLIELR